MCRRIKPNHLKTGTDKWLDKSSELRGPTSPAMNTKNYSFTGAPTVNLNIDSINIDGIRLRILKCFKFFLRNRILEWFKKKTDSKFVSKFRSHFFKLRISPSNKLY